MKQLNNKTLLIILIVLIAGFVLSKVYRSPSRESNIAKDVIVIDTSQITAIEIYGGSGSEGELKLVKGEKEWQVQQNQRTANMDLSLLKSTLTSLRHISPERVVTRKKEKWNDYQVDSTGIRIQVMGNDETIADLHIGKNSTGTSFIRAENEEEVFEVSEPLYNSFNKTFNEWRDKTFVRLNPDQITRISFSFPADSGYVVSRENGGWLAGESKADSSKVQTYINKFRFRNQSTFADDFMPQVSPTFSVILSGDSMQTEINAWKEPGDRWIVSSGVHKDTYFTANETLIQEFFVGKNYFLE